ncbi:hypothetical protein DH2020_002964 [Rehmannia glutinosa]|uniref:CCHC-type domain-containing protein n=1 Tax=Rehmannia glutinosa TaxID=99300 RepID=A0ABR0XVN5_REHGL
MAEDLEKLYARLSLNANEEILIPTSAIIQDNTDLNLCLVGKILAPRIISPDQISSLFKRLWSPKGSFSCKSIHDNICIFSFDNLLDKKKVLASTPWLFDRYLLVLHDAVADINPSEINYSHCDFWVQLHHLPLGLMNKEFAKIAGNSIGRFLETDTDAFGSVMGKYIRIKVNIDITKPLHRVIHADVHGQKRAIYLKYERLPDFCFHCGIIGHVFRDCETRILNPPENSENFEFGNWLKAPYGPSTSSNHKRPPPSPASIQNQNPPNPPHDTLNQTSIPSPPSPTRPHSNDSISNLPPTHLLPS